MDPETPETEQAGMRVRNGLVGVARGETVDVSRSLVALSASRGTVSARQGMVGALLTGGDASVVQGYATMMAAAGDATLKQAGTQWFLAAGDVDVEYGGALLLAAPRVTMRRSFVGLLVARHAHLEDGAKVLLKPTGAAAFGAALGVAFALVAAVAFGTRSRK